MSEQEVYDAGRGWWKLGSRAEREKYALLTALGVVRQVIEITGWDQAGADRRAFEGTILGPGHPMYEQYFGQVLEATSRNPIGYLDDDTETPCRCGCGESAKNLWLPGHDQRAIHDRIRRDFDGDVAAFIDWYDQLRR